MNVLSIDFDYFVDASREVRDTCFPQAEDDQDLDEVLRRWDICYERYPAIRDIGMTVEFGWMQRFLRGILQKKGADVVIRDSHRELYDAVRERADTVERLVNVDFHHDWYCMYGGGKVTCANWLRKLVEDVPCEPDILWVKRKDSETGCLEGEFPWRMTEDIRAVMEREDYTLIYLCYSPEWTPPHLRGSYRSLI